MRVAILAGGKGTRLAEETEIRPKPMVEIGDHPMLWHIMSHFSHYHFTEFVVAVGYRGDYIRNYFSQYNGSRRNIRVDLASGVSRVHGPSPMERWIVELIETGRDTNTSGRIRLLKPYLGDKAFIMTYGDGLSDVDLDRLVDFHRSHGRIATVTAVHPPPRFGQVVVEDNRVTEFTDKPIADAWINGGYFVLEPEIFEYLSVEDDNEQWERGPLMRMVKDRQVMAYRHDGFWQCMDAMRDKVLLERLWNAGNPPWKVWSS